MREEKFKIINFIRELIINIDKNLDNFPKKDIELKNRLRNNSYDLLEIAYKANSTTCVEKKKEYYKPKERRIVSQNLQDKVINHLVARYILYPAIMPCLIEQNVASRKCKGTRKGLEYAKMYDTKCKIKYKSYYILKFDISKFFASIDKEILKEKINRKIKDKDALEIIFKIIDSEEQGLGIGSMTSQCLAIFYLNDLDHFIKEKLKIKYYIRYQDDGLIFHKSKEYLNYCFNKIEEFLDKEHLKLNNKSRIYKNTNNFVFLGRSRKGKYAKYRNIKRKIKYRRHLYEEGKIELMGYINTINCYKNLIKKNRQ